MVKIYLIREIDPTEVVATLKGFEQRLIRHSKDNEAIESAFSSPSLQRKSGSYAGGYKGKKSWKNKEKKIFVKQNEKNNVYGEKNTGNKEGCMICGNLHCRECWSKGKL